MDTIITSAQNPNVKHIRKLLSSSKARREAALYVAEGIHLVQSYLTAGKSPLRYICAESALKNPEIIALRQKLQNSEHLLVSDDIFESLMSVHAPVGIAILFTSDSVHADTLPSTHTSILLEDIQDPGNVGTILRTAAATGVRDAFLSSGCASPWSQKALRAGMGAQFSMAIHEDSPLQTLVTSSPVPTLVTTLSSQSQLLYTTDLTDPTAWIFGNEGQGVSRELTQKARTHVSIPQEATAVESLNVAAAAAVCLYEQYRQQMH